MMIVRLATVLALLAAGFASQAHAAESLTADSRAPFVHRINLYSANGTAISATDSQPWSPRVTCGKCHEYDTIATGWHFNAGTSDSLAGRPGEPWILADAKTGSQIPLSRRGWQGTYKPEQIGLSDWEFVKHFGRHMPGGGVGEHNAAAAGGEGAAPLDEDAGLFDLEAFTATPAGAASAEPKADGNWHQAGNLEIDCLSCHSGSMKQNQAERAAQIADDNFKFVPTVTSGLGVVRGSTRLLPANATANDPNAPVVIYNASAFDADNRVFMDVQRSPSNQRCYFCHTTNSGPGDLRMQNWERDGDVHLTSGLSCTDCHRHGLDHEVTRGYAGEPAMKDHAGARTLSCAGCHYGEGPDVQLPAASGFQNEPLGGRLGSPIYDHPGLPPVHFDKLTCTACHSGPYPGEQSRLVMTSFAHELGLSDEHRTIQRPPFIEEPLFVLNADGKIEPRKAVWPAFWAAQGTSETLTPLKPEDVAKAAGDAFRNSGKPADAWKEMSDEEITAALNALAGKPLLKGAQPVYVAAGMLYTLDAAGALQTKKDKVAEAYTWPLAHDVRPASQSLGARSCQECHAQDTALFYSKTLPAAPVALAGPGPRMFELRGEDPVFLRAWETSFGMRLALKIVGFTACGILGLLLLAHLLSALAGASAGQAARDAIARKEQG